MNVVEKHPQRQEIIDAIIAGKPLRHVAATLKPPLHHATLARYRLSILGTATQSMRGTHAKGKALRDLAAASGVLANPDQQLTASRDGLRKELEEAIKRDEERVYRWISDAESYQTVNPETGEVTHNMEHGALARHVRNLLSAKELRGKFGGLLQDGASNNTTVAINLAFGGVPAEAAPVPNVIEIESTRG